MPITKNDIIARDFLLGIIRLHILYHASQEPVFGLDLLRELATHGYQLSPGTLYPILHSLEEHGFLASARQTVAGKVRKYYRITPAGAEVFAAALVQVHELLREIGMGVRMDDAHS
jgi:DNA-binding PadR family transcriptional regulator